MFYYVYILYSRQLNKFYVGSSSNPQERLKKHLANHKGFTATAKDWSIVYTKEFSEKSAAIGFEREIKRWKSAERIRKLAGLAHPGF